MSTQNTDGQQPPAPSLASSKAWMLGPKAENQDFFERLFLEVFRDCCYWRRNFHPEDEPFVTLEDRLDASFTGYQDQLHDELQRLIARLRSGVPFFNPRYVGHMLTDQFMAGFLGYAAAMFHNQNTLVQEVAPGTLEFEGAAMQQIGVMLGLDADLAWGHLCAGGTAANMESLWIARNIRLFPYLLRKAVDDASAAVSKKLKELALTDDRAGATFGQRPDDDGIHRLTIDQIVRLHKSLKAYLAKRDEDTVEDLELKAAVAVQVQKWSPAKLGMVNALRECGPNAPRFKVLIGKNAHYSLLKAVGLIGLGEDDVVKIDSVYDATAHDADRMPLRMDLDKLREALADCDRNRNCVLAVIGVYGTTEVAAVDPLKQILAIRQARRDAGKGDFWLHADACYGGYAAAMLHGGKGAPKELAAFIRDLAERTGSSYLLETKSGEATGAEDRLQVRLVQHTLALAACDSISLDPHKLGYIPYPAGAILFRDRVVREFIKYEAPYLNAASQKAPVHSQTAAGIMFPEAPEEPDADEQTKERIPWYEGEMSSYTLEGSRPGATAAAVYLAHKTIPLNQEGHGAMVGQTVLGAWKLIRTLSDNLTLEGDNDGFGVAFLNPEPDLNIVCYTFPGQFKLPGMRRAVPIPLAVVNEAVRRLYQEFLPTAAHPMPTRDFVIAKTALSYEKYQRGLATVWERLSGGRGVDLVGQLVPHNQLTTGANPWRDDSEIVLVRTAIMGPFFLTARTRHKKTVDLAELYSLKLREALFRLVRDIFDAPLPEDRRPRLPAPLLIVEDNERELAAMRGQFSRDRNVDYRPGRDDREDGRGLLDSARTLVEAIETAQRTEARAALVDIGLGKDFQGGLKFLSAALDREEFKGAVVFTSQGAEKEIQTTLGQEVLEKCRAKKKHLYTHDKPEIDSRHYQARMNLVLADLWQILLDRPARSL